MLKRSKRKEHIDPEASCMCGHARFEHKIDFDEGTRGCTIYFHTSKWDGCYNFKLDNLAYVELLEKKRNKK